MNLTNHAAVGEYIHVVCTGRQEFFYVPVYCNGLFFTRIFNVFLDRIADVAVFKLELVARTLGQYLVIRFRNTYINGFITRLCRNVLHDGE